MELFSASKKTINDLDSYYDDLESLERILRIQLASLCRLFIFLGWKQPPFGNHQSVRIKRDNHDYILITVENCLYFDVTASSILGAQIQDLISMNPISKMHSIIYKNTESCSIIHLNTKAVASISCLKCGIRRISMCSLKLNNIVNYSKPFVTNSTDEEEFIKVLNNQGKTANIIILRNNGMLCIGKSIHEAFHYAYYCQEACKIQLQCIKYINEEDFTKDVYELDLHKDDLKTPNFIEFQQYFIYYLSSQLSFKELYANESNCLTTASDNSCLQSITKSDSQVYINYYDLPYDHSKYFNPLEKFENMSDNDLNFEIFTQKKKKFPKSESFRELLHLCAYKDTNLDGRKLSIDKSSNQFFSEDNINSCKNSKIGSKSYSFTSGVERAIAKRVLEKSIFDLK